MLLFPKVSLFPPRGLAEIPASSASADRPALDPAFIFVGVCCGLFILSVFLGLNGSSSAFWARALQTPDEPTGLIAGSPRLTRSDEWMVWTPAALNQLHHVPPMPVKNPALGAGVSPLLMSLPVRHYSVLFRPQLWGFFFFDAERGFSWFWNTKAFGLLLSFFFLFRKLLRGRVVLAILGSVAVSYSSLVQWFFSSPTMLPEMLASWALLVLAGWHLFERAASTKKLGAAFLFVSCAVNFALCCYPPFQIPLVYLAVVLLAVFLWEKRAASWRGGAYWLVGALLLSLALLWPIFAQCRETLEIISQTSYPGARRTSGGTMSFVELFSGLLNFFDGNRPHAEIFPNTSEASNFFPIWLAVLAGVAWRWEKQKTSGGQVETIGGSSALNLALVGFILFFSAYALVGFPEWLCRATALNFVTEKRAQLAIGVAGLLLTFLSLPADNLPLARDRIGRSWIPTILGLCVLAYFWVAQRLNPEYLAPKYCALLIGLAVVLIALYFFAKPLVFAAGFAGVLLLNNGLVNPVAEGLPLLLRSGPARHIAAIYHADPTAGWAAYERGITAQFILASGARVLNGVKTTPDLELWGRLDPSGANRAVYNRYAFIVFGLPKEAGTPVSFELQRGADSYRAFVSPQHPALRAAGLKYVVFPRPLAGEEMRSMELIDSLPENLLWIYRLNPDAAEQG